MSETASQAGMNRAALLKTAGGAGAAIAFGGLVAASTARASGLTDGDVDILIAAEIAEALAVDHLGKPIVVQRPCIPTRRTGSA